VLLLLLLLLRGAAAAQCSSPCWPADSNVRNSAENGHSGFKHHACSSVRLTLSAVILLACMQKGKLTGSSRLI
jgi:hypothetical protein